MAWSSTSRPKARCCKPGPIRPCGSPTPKRSSMRKSPRSMMPTGLLDTLTDQELSDLYAYLRTLAAPLSTAGVDSCVVRGIRDRGNGFLQGRLRNSSNRRSQPLEEQSPCRTLLAANGHASKRPRGRGGYGFRWRSSSWKPLGWEWCNTPSRRKSLPPAEAFLVQVLDRRPGHDPAVLVVRGLGAGRTTRANRRGC